VKNPAACTRGNLSTTQKDPFMLAQPQKEHQWLDKLVGEWAYVSEATMGPGQPPQKFHGKETVRSLGGLWVIGEGEGQMPGGGTARMIITIGYDADKKKYVGSWVGSMMTFQWIYEGFVDDRGKLLTLNTTGPNFADGGKTTTNFQELIEFIDDDHRTFSSRMQTADGTWQTFMTAHYTRKK
jgi:hypothetical protein